MSRSAASTVPCRRRRTEPGVRRLPSRVGLLLALLAWHPRPDPGFAAESPDDAAPAETWPMARGSLTGTGRSEAVLRLPPAEAWRRTFDKTAFGAVPVIAGGTVFVGDLDGRFHALALADGSTLWTVTARDAGFPSAAAVSTDPGLPLVVVGDDVGLVRALDPATGEVRWTHETGGEISGGPAILPTSAGPRLLVGSQDASLSCLDLASGRLLWKHSITDQIRCAPTVARSDAGDRIFLAGCDGRLHIIDAARGEEVAAVEIDGPTGTTPAATSDRVFFGTEGGSFYAIDHREARVAWRVGGRAGPGGGGQAYRSSAALVAGLAVVGSRGRAVEALEVGGGAPAWRHPMRGRVDASPIAIRAAGAIGPETDAVILADTAGTIVVLAATSGEPLWEFAAGGGFSAGAAIAGDRFVLASDDGEVWCFQGAR